jgi:ribosomal protein S18 acetylase RimI-like enzyme
MSKPSSVLVRLATRSDLNTIVSFNAALAQETENRALDVQILQAGVETILRDPLKGWYAVAEKQQDNTQLLVVGQILVTFEWSDWRNGNFWWLQSLYVQTDHRQQGIFRKLFDFVCTQAQLTCERICGVRLYVEENNQQAQQAYANLGFQKSAYHMYEKEFPSVDRSFPASRS